MPAAQHRPHGTQARHRKFGSMAASSSRSSHTTQYQGMEITIHYRHHPLAGCRLVVEYGVRNAVGLVFMVPRPNGRFLAIPSWMTETWAADLPICASPCVSLGALQDLRRLLDDVLPSLAAPSAEGDGDDYSNATPTTDLVRIGTGSAGAPDTSAHNGDDDGGEAASRNSSQRSRRRRNERVFCHRDG